MFAPLVFWPAFTKLADTVVLLPAAMLCVLWLAWGRAWRLAVVWAMLLGAGIALMAATKLAFIGWGIGIRELDFTGFSGHAMRATAIIPVMFYLFTAQAPHRMRQLAVAAGVLFGVLIGISRIMVRAHSCIMVRAHSWSEVISGCLLGALVGSGLLAIVSRAPRPVLPSWAFGLGLLILLPVPLSSSAPTEQWLQHIALFLSRHGKPFTRADW